MLAKDGSKFQSENGPKLRENDPKRSKNGPKRLKNGPKRFKMIQNSSKRFKTKKKRPIFLNHLHGGAVASRRRPPSRHRGGRRQGCGRGGSKRAIYLNNHVQQLSINKFYCGTCEPRCDWGLAPSPVLFDNLDCQLRQRHERLYFVPY